MSSMSVCSCNVHNGCLFGFLTADGHWPIFINSLANFCAIIVIILWQRRLLIFRYVFSSIFLMSLTIICIFCFCYWLDGYKYLMDMMAVFWLLLWALMSFFLVISMSLIVILNPWNCRIYFYKRTHSVVAVSILKMPLIEIYKEMIVYN